MTAAEASRVSGVASLGAWARVNEVLQPASRREQIAIALREAIVSGAIAAGQQLKQDELSAHFNVSPAPVREALRQLESEGLVEHYPNRGVFVTDVPVEEALEVLLPVRLLVENYALSRTAVRLDANLVTQMEAQIAAMRRGADEGDVKLINDADVRFHELAVEASDAHHTIQLWHSVESRIRLQFSRLTPWHANLQYVADEHTELLSALQKGDAAELESVLKQHIVGTSARLMEHEQPPL